MPSRSIRCPPVSLTIGTCVLLGDVGDPAQLLGSGDAAPHLRDDRERAVLLDVGVHAVVDEPRPSRSSGASAPHIIFSSEARPILDFASSAPSGRERREDLRHRAKIARRGSRPSARACPSGCRARSSGRTGPPRRRRRRRTPRSARPVPCTSRSPCRPGSGSMTPVTVLQPPLTARTMVALQTPLQLQTWASSASSATPTSAGGPPRSNSSSTRSSGSGRPRSKACCRNATFLLSPSSVAPTILSSRMTTDLKTPRCRLGEDDVLVGVPLRPGQTPSRRPRRRRP